MTQYGHEGRHHGIGTPDCPRDLHHHHDERCSPPDADEEIPVIVSAFEILPNGVKVPIGKPRERTISRGAMDLLHGSVPAALADRRQRAREAFHDEWSRRDKPTMSAVNEAIETATRVRITPEIESAAEAAAGPTIHDYDGGEMRAVLAAAFRAAGFEVEE